MRIATGMFSHPFRSRALVGQWTDHALGVWWPNNSLQRPGTIKCMARGRAMQVGKPTSAPEALRPAAELGR
jgi:hypothetical protein